MRLSSRIAPVPSKQFHIGRAAYSTLESQFEKRERGNELWRVGYW